MHIFTQTTCEGQEWSETSEETLVSVGHPAASSWMSWPVMAAQADRRAQHWRLIASNEQHCSPQKRTNSGLPQKLQHFNPLWCESPHWKLFGHHIPMPERERGFLWKSIAHSKVRRYPTPARWGRTATAPCKTPVPSWAPKPSRNLYKSPLSGQPYLLILM